MMTFYAVARGWKVGIYRTWTECNKQVFQFPRARFKKFKSEQEAKDFIEESGGVTVAKPRSKLPLKEEKSVVTSQCTSETDELGFIMKDGIPVVYTDGACTRNGNFNPKAGIGVFWGDNHKWNVSAPVAGRATNNVAEYSAIICAIERAISEGFSNLIIRTDCRLIISSMDSWIYRWKNNGWKTAKGNDVLNKDLLDRIFNLRSQVKVYFEKVDGHSGDYNNDQADRLAKEGASLYTG